MNILYNADRVAVIEQFIGQLKIPNRYKLWIAKIARERIDEIEDPKDDAGCDMCSG